MRVRQSILDATVTVIEIDDTDSGGMVDLFESRGHGYTFLNVDLRTVVLDCRSKSGLTRNQLLAVEAHEIAHLHVGADESAADKMGVRLLRESKHHMAARVLSRR
jgi:hypothetical protein